MTVTRINLSPARPVLDGRNLGELTDLFIEDRRQTLNPKTVRNYRNYLAHFLDWWLSYGPSHDWLLDEAALVTFLRHLERKSSQAGRPLAWRTRYFVLVHLRLLFHWAYRRHYTEIDFARFVPSIKGKPPVRTPIALDVVSALLAGAGSTRYAARNRAIIAMLAGTGIRCHECAALAAGDVTLHADLSGYVSVRTAKGNRPRLAALDQAAGAYIALWLDERYRQGAEATDALFPSGHNLSPMQPGNIYRIIRTCAAHAGIAEQIRGAHDLRRLFATHWARQLPGQTYARLLQRQLGHANFAMTSQYMLLDASDILEVMSREGVSPMAQVRTPPE